MENENYVTIEKDAFKLIMIKLDKIESFVQKSESLINVVNETIIKKNENKEIVSASEAAKLLNCCKRTIYRYKDKGLLPFLQHGGKISFLRSDLTNFDYNKDHKNKHSTFDGLFTGKLNKKK